MDRNDTDQEVHHTEQNERESHRTYRRNNIFSAVINIILLLFLVGIIGTVLEYFGIFNFFPNFGRQGDSGDAFGFWNSDPEFSDVAEDAWVKPFVVELSQEDVIQGYPNGEFRPERSVTRAEFAAMIESAFGNYITPDIFGYTDIPDEFWAEDAIAEATAEGFLTGFPNNEYRPEQRLRRVNALVAIVNGLNLGNSAPVEEVLQVYVDADQIPGYARAAVAAATEAGLVVNYPYPNQLNPMASATRGDVAAFIYQALAEIGEVEEVNSQFIVNPPS